MLRTPFRAAAVVAVLLLSALPGQADDDGMAAAPAPKVAAKQGAPEICPLALIQPGLRGHGLTVVQGTKIERFEVEVIDIVPGFLAKQDLILIRLLDERFKEMQVVQGMSGSPIYLRGKLAGALSYTWDWSKQALAGVTPIETMLAEGARPLEGRPNGAEPPTGARRKNRPATAQDDTAPRPIGTPVTFSGFSPSSRRDIVGALTDLGIHAVDGGAIGRAGNAAWQKNTGAKLEPGAALVVEMVRGDFQVASVGTCTLVDGKTVYGFGHPFQSLGETRMPMSVGYIYMTVPSRKTGFKMGGALEQVGAIVQDRPSGVVGHLAAEAFMLPCDVKFSNAKTKRTEDFHFEIAHNRHVLPKMLVACVQEAFRRAETTLGHNTKRYAMTLKIKGMEPWTFSGAMGGFDGGFQRVLIHLVDKVLNNQKQRVELESFKLHVDVEHVDRRAKVVNVTASKDEVRPGDELDLFVTLERREGGEAVREKITVRVPRDAPAGNLELTVLGGDFVAENAPEARDIADMPAYYRTFYKSTELCVVLPTGRVDIDIDGRLLKNLPVSSLPRLARSPGGQNLKLKPVLAKHRIDVPYVVGGRFRVMVRVSR